MKRLIRKYAETTNWSGKTKEESEQVIKNSPYADFLSSKYKQPPNVAMAFWGYQNDKKIVDHPKIYVIELFQFNRIGKDRHDTLAICWRYDKDGIQIVHHEILFYPDETAANIRKELSNGFTADSCWINIKKLEDFTFQEIFQIALEENGLVKPSRKRLIKR